MSANLDPALMSTLTDEEREAIQSSDLSPEELAAMQRIAAEGAGEAGAADAGAGDDGDDDGDDGVGEGAQGAAPLEGAAAALAPAPAPAAADPAAATREPAPRAPRYEARLPEDFDARVKTLGEKEAELKRQFRAGEIEFDDFEAQRDELLRERETLTIARTKAEISQEMTAQTAEQLWTQTVDTFIAQAAKAPPEQGGIDYRKDTEKAGDLDTFVKMLANKAENSDKPMDWFLAEAHKRVQALHGLRAADAPAPAPAPAPAAARGKPDLRAVPATLAQVPGSDGPGDVAGEFADVMSLEGQAYEDAIARMTPAQRERFLRAA
jgi:hypothetical protein